jgi:PAS domain S-box-containing protein
MGDQDVQERRGRGRGRVATRLGWRRGEQRLRLRTELILNAAAEGIFGVDTDGLITFANPAAERMLGWTVFEMVERDAHQLLHHTRADGSPYRPEECPISQSYRDGAVHMVDHEVFWTRDGVAVPVEYTSTPLSEEGRLLGAVVTFRDLTERQHATELYGELARLSEQQAEQHLMVERLQAALLPPLAVLDDVDLGVHYLSADPTMPTGGDMYDCQVLPDGDLHLMVIDVMGKGVEATKGALAVLHTVRVLVLEGYPMDRLVGRAHELLSVQDESLVATLLIARYTPSTGRLRLAGGGHPPALLVSAAGEVHEVPSPGLALGWPGAGSTSVVELELGRADTVVLYTDGLIEATKDIVAGLDALRAAASETAGYPTRHLARALVERALHDAARHDDTLTLVLRRRLPPPPSELRRLGPFEYRFSPSAAAVSLARHFFTDWLCNQPADISALDDLLVMVSELCTNAVRAASGAPGGVSLRAWDEGDRLVLEVEDDGGGNNAFELPDEEHLPDPEATGGRGLFLVRALADAIDVLPGADGTIVRVTRRDIFPPTLNA